MTGMRCVAPHQTNNYNTILRIEHNKHRLPHKLTTQGGEVLKRKDIEDGIVSLESSPFDPLLISHTFSLLKEENLPALIMVIASSNSNEPKWVRFVTGGLASSTAEIFTLPIDTTKVGIVFDVGLCCYLFVLFSFSLPSLRHTQ